MPDDPRENTPSADPFADVLAEILQAEEQGQAPDLERLVTDFPDLKSRLRAYFRDREMFARLAAQLAPPSQPSPDAGGGLGGGGVGDSTTPHDASAGPPAPLQPGMRFGGYEILEELGRGGMGVVYKARQLTPERLVALKVIRTDRLEGLPEQERRQWIDRFHREAQLVAGLEQHPHIVTLYEVGDHEGQPYFTMQLVAGGSLAQRLRLEDEADAAAANRRVSGQRDNARLLAQAARAVDYAHRRGVLHRDLKPGNILLDAEGRPLVGDFGLARRLDETGSLVASGIEGTAAYMAPEQARAAKGAMTTAADVYGLGAILYEALTGRPPFHGKNDLETLLSVLGDEPAHPRALDRRLSRDLATVCLKCLEKEPSRRYRSAAALAEDLDNWLEGRPINARPVGAAERWWRWCRRNPFLAASLGTAAVALIAFAVVSGLFGLYRDRANRDLERAAGDLKTALASVKEQRDNATTANGLLLKEQRANKETAAGLALDRGLAAWRSGNEAEGLLWTARSLTLAPDDDAGLQEAIRMNLTGWAATLPPAQAPLRHPGVVARVAFTPDGHGIVALSSGSVRLEEKEFPNGQKGMYWVHRPETIGDDPMMNETASGVPTALDTLLHPSRRLAGPRGQVIRWDADTDKPVEIKSRPDSQVLAVTPDGKTALTTQRQERLIGPCTVQVWDLTTGKAVGDAAKFNVSIQWAACAPDGKTFVALCTLGETLLTLWDPATGARSAEFTIGRLGSGHEVRSAAFSPDGTVLAIVTGDPRQGSGTGPLQNLTHALNSTGGLTLIDLKARKELLVLPFGDGQVDPDSVVAIGPGGRLLLTAGPPDVGDGSDVRLWDREAKTHIGLPYEGQIALAQFSPNGAVLLTVSRRDSTEVVRLWDTATGKPLGAPLLPRGNLEVVTFSPDGKWMAAATEPSNLIATDADDMNSGEFQVWDAATGLPLGRAFRHTAPVLSIAFSPDGKRLITGGSDGLARVWDLFPQPVGLKPIRETGSVVVVSADGSRLLVRGEDGSVRLHETASGKPLGKPVPLSAKDRKLALGSDMRTLVVADTDGKARLWDAVAGEPIGPPLQHLGPVAGIRFIRDGHTVVTLVQERSLLSQVPIAYQWDAATGRSLGFLIDPNISMACAQSRDGGWAPCAFGSYAVVVSMADGKQPGKPLKHRGQVVGGLFSPDGRVVLTIAGRSGSWEEARLWEVATGEPLGPPMPHQGPIRAAAFSPDGRLVLTGSDDGTARLWNAATGEPAGPPLLHGGRVRAVAFRSDGRLAATGSEDGTARLWHVAACRPLGPPLPHQAPVSVASFLADGETLVTAGGDGRVRLWKVPQPADGPAERLLLRAEALTGMELDGASPHLLDEAERSRRWQQLEPKDSSSADEKH